MEETERRFIVLTLSADAKELSLSMCVCAVRVCIKPNLSLTLSFPPAPLFLFLPLSLPPFPYTISPTLGCLFAPNYITPEKIESLPSPTPLTDNSIFYTQLTLFEGSIFQLPHNRPTPIYLNFSFFQYFLKRIEKDGNSQQFIISACQCDEAGTTSQICTSVASDSIPAGSCICKANVAPSVKCDRCKNGHFGMDAENPLGCTGT